MNVTYRIYALTDGQIDSLLRFLESAPKVHTDDQTQQPECPLPILGDYDNLNRIEPEVAIPMHNVFRDRWERKAMWNGYQEYSRRRMPCVRHGLDFPELRRRFERREQQGKQLTFGEFVKKRQDEKDSCTQSST